MIAMACSGFTGTKRMASSFLPAKPRHSCGFFRSCENLILKGLLTSLLLDARWEHERYFTESTFFRAHQFGLLKTGTVRGEHISLRQRGKPNLVCRRNVFSVNLKTHS